MIVREENKPRVCMHDNKDMSTLTELLYTMLSDGCAHIFHISTLQSTGICHNWQKKTVQCVLKYPPMEGFSAILFTHSQQLCRYSYPITLWPIAPIHNCGTNWCVDGILTHVGIDVIWILIRRNSTCLLL